MTNFSMETRQTDSILSTERKYNGLIQESWIKATRNRLFELQSYMDSIVSNFYMMHTIVSIWRLVQLFGPCLVSGYSSFWKEGSVAKEAVGYITILAFICPAQYRIQASVPLEFISFCLFCGFLVMVIWSGYHYRKTSKLPDGVPALITIIQGSAMYIVPPMGLEAGFEALGLVVTGGKYQYHIGLEIAAVVCVSIAQITLSWYITNVNAISLVFRPNSLMTVYSTPAIFLLIVSAVVVTVTAFGANLPKVGRIVCTLLGAVGYALIAYIPFMPGSFVSHMHSRMIFAEGVTGAAFLILVAVYDGLNKQAAEVELFILIGFLVIMSVVSVFVLNGRIRKHLEFLDVIMDDSSQVEAFKSPGHLVDCACTGMEYAHPVALDWSIFKAGTERWPDSVQIWHIFGKFAAIYPDEESMLSLVVHNIMMRKLSGSVAKATIAQAATVLRTRETALSPGLKRKLNHAQKRVQTTKRKMRQIWDLVIQGNVNEMQGAVNMAFASVQRSHNDYNHLCAEYPNNKYVTRSYCRFLQEILADQRGFEEWHEKLRLMQRGLRVNVDKTNVIGLHAFPRLPVTTTGNTKTMQSIENDSAVSSDVLDMDDDQAMVQTEQSTVIREKIDRLTIPSHSCTVKTNLFIVCLTILVPGILACVLVPWFINSQTDPLMYMYYMSFLRSLTYQVPCFAHRWTLEKWPAGDPIFEPMEPVRFELTSFGRATDTLGILQYILAEVTSSLESLAEYRGYEQNNKELATARKIAFEKSITYSYYSNQTTSTPDLITLQDALTDFVIQTGNLIAADFNTVDPFDSPFLLNPIQNANMLADQISLAMESLSDYIVSVANDADRLALILLGVGIVFILVVYLLALCLEVKGVLGDNREVYRCLTALPKNVVSSLSESLRVLQKESQDASRASECDTETSKQEENVMKVFANAGDSSMMEIDKILFLFCMLFCCLFAILIIVVACICVIDVAASLTANAPHINYVLGASCYLDGTILSMNQAIALSKGHGIGLSMQTTLLRYNNRLNTFIEYYHLSRFGGNEADQKPNPSMEDGIAAAAEKLKCEDPLILPQSFEDIYYCYSADIQLILVIPFMIDVYETIYAGAPDYANVNPQDRTVTTIWNLGAVKLYDAFLFPMFQVLVPDLHELMQSNIPPAQGGIIALMVLSVLLYLFSLVQLNSNREKVMFTMKLLNHCPPQVILQTPKIMDVLGGDFTDQSKDKTQRDNEFFDHVVLSIPDAVLIANNQLIIEVANKATQQILHFPPEQLIGQNLREFLSASHFQSDMSKILEGEGTSQRAEYRDPETEHIAFFEVTSVQYNQTWAVTFRDQTQNVLYNTLIEEERMKSDRLLASILPANLVPRVQRGEKNISFAVQSATITFMDIVEFTPWCASNTAVMVMKTLNHIYREFDALCATFPTMTKIKCIGDCYMAAGGIFSEVNQPAQHAREVVSFGLKAIEAILSVNQALSQNLRIRCGINTGGPIVAGVLGTEKPTFEILGPAINMAQQMEHNGVPMKVHISRPVYELIYGGSFHIKERGQIEIKNGSVLTYLVEPQL